MTKRSLCSLIRPINQRLLHSATSHFSQCQKQEHPYSSLSQPDPSPSSQDVNEICRLLSDYRKPQHDLESHLGIFATKISTSLVEQVLKRCKNLGFSAHRFYLWARNLPGFSHSTDMHHILIDGLGNSREFPFIWDFISEIKETGDAEIDRKVFWIIFRAYSRANLPNDAIHAFNRMIDFGVKPNIDDLNYLLYALCKRKHVKNAHHFFDKVKLEYQGSAKSYSILIKGWGDAGNCLEARNLFAEMLERKCSLDVVAYNSLLESLCKAGNINEAYKLLLEMGSNKFEPNACSYSIFIRAYCESGDIHTALRVLDTMRRNNLVPNVYTYNIIIKKLCKDEKVEEAYQLLDEMIEKGVKPDLWSYNTIAAFHCDRCEVNKALRLITRMDKDCCLPDRHTYNMVLKMLIRVGRFDRAMGIWEGMGERGFYPPVSTYAVMIHGLCKKKGKLEEACRHFEMMIDEGIPPYPATCEMLRNRLIGLGFSEQVHILAHKMQRSTSCLIQELAYVMRGDKGNEKLKSEHSWKVL